MRISPVLLEAEEQSTKTRGGVKNYVLRKIRLEQDILQPSLGWQFKPSHVRNIRV